MILLFMLIFINKILTMPNKKIDQLAYNNNPTVNDVFPQVNNGVTTQLSFIDFGQFIAPFMGIVTGATYSDGVIIFTNSTGGTFSVTGITSNIKHWEENQNKKIKSDETIVISGNYVLENTNLTLESEKNYVIGDIEFNKYAQMYIGGNLLVKDSTINNNGSISVAGGIIMSGNSTITGTGIIN